MRARRYQLSLETLDSRLLLDASTGWPSSGPTDVGSTPDPGDEIDPVDVINYYGDGNPPADPAPDPLNPEVAVPDMPFQS